MLHLFDFCTKRMCFEIGKNTLIIWLDRGIRSSQSSIVAVEVFHDSFLKKLLSINKFYGSG